MRSEFIGHYPLTDEDYERLWGNGTFVFDTNSLLNLYRYSIPARNDFMSALRQLADRIWMPYQVAEEFHRNRVDIIWEQHNIGKEVASALDKLSNQAAGSLSAFMKNAFLDVPELQRAIARQFEQIKSEVADLCRKGMTEYGVTPQADPVLLEVAKLYQNRIGDPYTADEQSNAQAAADIRFDQGVPPGYKDSNKSGSRQYGDYILWRQSIEYAVRTESDLVIVTDENKEDWWWKSNGETLGPRPELREEFFRETGRICYLYRPAQFLKRHGERTKQPVSDKVVEEIRNTSKIVASQEKKVTDRVAAGKFRHVRDLMRELEAERRRHGESSSMLAKFSREQRRLESYRDRKRVELDNASARAAEAVKLREDISNTGADERQLEILQEVLASRVNESNNARNDFEKLCSEIAFLEHKRLALYDDVKDRYRRIHDLEDHLSKHQHVARMVAAAEKREELEDGISEEIELASEVPLFGVDTLGETMSQD